MVITLSILLWIYLIIVAIFMLYSAFGFYHLFKFGMLDTRAFAMTAFFLGGVVVILFVTFIIGVDINWSNPLFQVEQFDTNLPI